MPAKISTDSSDTNDLLDQEEAAVLLGISPMTLRRWRRRPDYPRHLEVIIGGRAKYRRVVLRRLIEGLGGRAA